MLDEIPWTETHDGTQCALVWPITDSCEPFCGQGSRCPDEVSEILEEAVRKVLFGRVLNG